jgi:hypothetical protein
MRQLGRLKKVLKEDSKTDYAMKDYLTPGMFDIVIKSVKRLVETYSSAEGVTAIKKPGLALRMGHNLRKLAQIKYGKAIRTSNTKDEKDGDIFLKLMHNEWNDYISSVALASIKTNKFNKPDVLPLTSDLLTLKNYVDGQMTTLSTAVKTNPSYSVWRALAEVTLARILLFNKRRGSEAAKLLISSYTSRPNWTTQANTEIVDTLSEIEKKLFNRYLQN